jgi:hypothetical protein
MGGRKWGQTLFSLCFSHLFWSAFEKGASPAATYFFQIGDASGAS